jgi:integrase
MRKTPPSLRRHKPSGQAVVTLGGHDHYLGAWPALCKKAPPDVQEAYDRLIAEWLANGRRPLVPAADAPAFTVNELMLAFWRHAEGYYCDDDGHPTGELRDYRLSLRPLKELYGRLAAADFSPLKLKTVRQQMVEAGWCRGLVNQRVGRVVRMFKWGVAEELVPETVYRALAAVPGLQKGRCEAPEPEPVGPVAVEAVEATLPHLLPPAAAMVRLQLLTGMRPGEACVLRGCDIDTSGAVWLYRPHRHKTKHRGKARVVALGPQAQAVIRPFLKLDTQAYLFSPEDAVEALHAARRLARKTKVQPSQAARGRKARPQRKPRARYTPDSYGKAVARACDRAFPQPEPLARREGETAEGWQARLTPEQHAELKAWRKTHRWHPHQLRHSHATEVRRRFGLEAAQVALGHARADVTQVYAERNLALAVKVAEEIG